MSLKEKHLILFVPSSSPLITRSRKCHICDFIFIYQKPNISERECFLKLYFRNVAFSAEEIDALINKFPKGEGDNTKSYFLHIRSFIDVRRRLKALISENENDLSH